MFWRCVGVIKAKGCHKSDLIVLWFTMVVVLLFLPTPQACGMDEIGIARNNICAQ